MSDPTVVDNPDRSRFEISVDGTVAGVAQYRREGNRLVLTHTEVSDEFEGQGLGSILVRGALDAARRSEERVVPLCPFVAAYLHRHPEDVDLVDDEHRAQFADDRS
jgi:predicted GNAT family acetyltransferase